MKRLNVLKAELTIKLTHDLSKEQLERLKHDLAFVINNYEARVGYLDGELEIDRILVGDIKDAGI